MKRESETEGRKEAAEEEQGHCEISIPCSAELLRSDALPDAPRRRRPRPRSPLLLTFFSSKKKLKNSKTDMATYNSVVSKMAEANYKAMCV